MHEDREAKTEAQAAVVLDDKDRLLLEKDKVTELSSQLWSGIVRQKDEENRRLQKKYRREKKKRKKLERANNKIINMKTKFRLLEKKVNELDSLVAGRVVDNEDDEIKDEDEDMADFNDTASTGFGRRFQSSEPNELQSETGPASDLAAAPLPTPPKNVWSGPASPGVEVEDATAPFTFAPVIEMTGDGDYRFGDIKAIATTVADSIQATISELKNRHEQGRHPFHPKSSLACAWNWSVDKPTRWTLQEPRQSARASCYNAQRACLLWLGNRKWAVLPLPTGVRKLGAACTDTGYYIRVHSWKVETEGIWLAARSRAKRST